MWLSESDPTPRPQSYHEWNIVPMKDKSPINLGSLPFCGALTEREIAGGHIRVRKHIHSPRLQYSAASVHLFLHTHKPPKCCSARVCFDSTPIFMLGSIQRGGDLVFLKDLWHKFFNKK